QNVAEWIKSNGPLQDSDPILFLLRHFVHSVYLVFLYVCSAEDGVTPERFFGWHIDPLSLGGKAMALLLAVLLGGLIGLERGGRGQAAGMRTHILVCVGSTLIALTSVEVGLGASSGGRPGDPGRIAAQIVSGIGFLGAGAIIREGFSVRGLTTAAS